MNHILLGSDRETNKSVRVPASSFDTHWHVIGGTGKGKTVSLITMLIGLLLNPRRRECHFIIDRMGQYAWTIIRWIATQAPAFIRERFLYIEGANEKHLIGFNPLVYDTPAHGYYKVSRATEIILRAWDSVDLGSMPRLARWCFNAFFAAANLGLNIADCVHFLLPFSTLGRRLLDCLPERLRFEWGEILAAGPRGTEILDSTRNRLKPYWESPNLQQMFSVSDNRLRVLEWMQQGKIVLINLAPQERIPEQVSDALGGLIINEVLSVARSLPMGTRYPTYLWLDEFQRFIGPDIEAAIPEVRQLGVKLILSHQSFSQLVQGEYDLSSLIWQCQSRLMFGVQGEDADILAHEIAALCYNARRIKDQLYTRRQLVTGHSLIELTSHSHTEALAKQWMESYGSTSSKAEHRRHHVLTDDTETRSRSDGKAQSDSRSRSDSVGSHQTLRPEYEQFYELCNRTYFTFDESKMEWARDIRKHKTGEALLRLVNDDTLYKLNVKRTAPGTLAMDWPDAVRVLPQLADQIAALLEENFAQDCFITPEIAERETRERLEHVLNAPIVLQSPAPVEEKESPLD